MYGADGDDGRTRERRQTLNTEYWDLEIEMAPASIGRTHEIVRRYCRSVGRLHEIATCQV